MSAIIIHSGRVITLGCEQVTYIENGYVRISKEGLITEIGKEPHPAPADGEKEHDAQGKLILPGFVCGHGHFYGLYSRGLNLLDEPATNFLEILERLWWRLDRALDDKDSNYYSAMIYTLEGLRCGTTTIVDHHASPSYINGSLDDLERATKDVGIRTCLCYEVTDRNGLDGAQKGIEENIRYMRKVATNKDDYTGACFGLHAPFTLSDETLTKCKDEMEKFRKEFPNFNAGFHIHVAEGQYDEEFSMEKYKTTCIERLEKFNILGENTIVGHGLFLNDLEMDILAKTKTNLMTNPESNMNNAIAAPKVGKLIKKGVLVGLGTDGMTYDMLQTYRTSCLLQKLDTHDPGAGTVDTYNMLFRNNSLIVSKFFNHPVGRLEVGAYGDVILVDYKCPTKISEGSMPWQLHFGITTSGVRNVFVGGKEIYRDGNCLSVDEAKIYKESVEKVCPHVWEKFANVVKEDKEKKKK